MLDHHEPSQVAAARGFGSALRPWIESACSLSWKPSDGLGRIVVRAALRRQLESLDVVIDLAEGDHGFAAVALLRPSCEELIWLRYLTTLRIDRFERLTMAMVGTGVLKDLKAQAGELGEDLMRAMGLHKDLARYRATDGQRREELKSLGRQLSWPKRSRKYGVEPSTWFIAMKTDSVDLYSFMYHATSRYVHFSPVELARQGWSGPGDLRIDPTNHESHWGAFSLCWAPRLLAWSVNACVDHVADTQQLELDWPRVQEALDDLTEIPLVPIITSDELHRE